VVSSAGLTAASGSVLVECSTGTVMRFHNRTLASVRAYCNVPNDCKVDSSYVSRGAQAKFLTLEGDQEVPLCKEGCIVPEDCRHDEVCDLREHR